MVERYDVIIVGGGIAGLKLAELFNSSTLKVLLLEKRPTIRKLVNHVYGTPWEYVKKWNLQKYVVQKCKFGFYGTEKRVLRDIPENPFTVVDVNPWAASLKLKCKVKTGVNLVNLDRTGEGVLLFDDKKNTYFCKIVVDCTGDKQLLAPWFGINKSAGDFLDYACIFKRANNVELNEMFYFNDRKLLNCGGWYYPLTKTTCLIGISEWTEEKRYVNNEKEFKKRMTTFIKTFYPFNKYIKIENKIEIIHKIGPVTQVHSSIAEDNYLASGDAAGAGTPFIGLGFYTALEMAQSTYNVISEAFKKNDFTRKILKKHQNNFHEEFGRHYKWSWLVRWIMLRYVTNQEVNDLAERLVIFNNKEYEDIILSRIKPSYIVRLFLGSTVGLKILKNAFIYHFLEPFGIIKLEKRPLKLKI